jgi:hypothetical protein
LFDLAVNEFSLAAAESQPEASCSVRVFRLEAGTLQIDPRPNDDTLLLIFIIARKMWR